ncbi:MAG: phosphatidylglycerophosphatase A [Endomicrobiia bacterium]
MKNLIIFLATGLGVGFLPFAPGTFGTILSFLIWWIFIPDKIFIQIIVLVSGVILAFFVSDMAEKIFLQKDEQKIVIDEIIGFWVALVGIPKKFIFVLLAFFIFRIFDVLKLPFIGNIQKLNGGAGIILDDILAGLLTNFLIHIIIFAVA